MAVLLSWEGILGLLSALIAGAVAGTGMSELALRRRLKVRDQWWTRFERALELLRTRETDEALMGKEILDDIGGVERQHTGFARMWMNYRRRYVRTPEDAAFLHGCYRGLIRFPYSERQEYDEAQRSGGVHD